MKISTKGRYALRMMLEFAMNPNECTKISQVAGYVKSMRGAQGGYKLAFSPEEYTVGMILRVTEGNLSPVACLEDATNQCERSQCCATLSVWEKLDKAINDVVDHITLADLVEEQKAMPDYNLM